MRITALAICLVLFGGCAASEDLPPEGPLGPGVKTVTSKVAPSTLVAVDGTICTVMPRRFETTKVGDRASCDWRSRSEGPRPVGGA